jgi:phage terminase large subunit
MFLPSPASTRPPAFHKTASAAFVRYITAAQQAGCPPDQIKQFVRLGIVLQPRQLEASAAARSCDREDGPTEIGYGGARGGGKSHWAVAQLTDDCLRFAGLKCLLLRKVGKANKENFGDLIRRILKKQKVSYTYTQHDGTLRFANGSSIILGHFQAEKDIDAYLGLEYDVIAVEEATTLSASKYRSIQTCNRTSKPGWRPRMYSTTNPGGIGHGWYKARFLDPHRKKTQTSTYFVSATIDDNAFVNKDYEKVLNSLCGWQLRAWRYGDWDIAAGQYFTNFRPQIDGAPYHVLPSVGFTIPANWQVWAALDYGFTHYTSVHLFAKDSDGRLFVVDEHCERGWVPKRHVPSIKEMLARNGLSLTRLWRFVAGADVFSNNPDGGTTADLYAELGVRLECANNDRIAGATRILSLLGDADATTKNAEGVLVPAPIPPTLFILDRCTRLIECLPALQHDPHRPEDVLKVDCDDDGLGGDDAYDDFRYGVMVDAQNPEKPLYTPGMAAGRQMLGR